MGKKIKPSTNIVEFMAPGSGTQALGAGQMWPLRRIVLIFLFFSLCYHSCGGKVMHVIMVIMS